MFRERTAVVCLAVYLCFVCGCGGPGIERRRLVFETGGDTIRLLSFNIRFGTADEGVRAWENRRDAVFDMLVDHGADIVALQEAMDFQVQQIRRALPVYRVAEARDAKTTGQFCPVLYRKDRFEVVAEGSFWFSNTPWLAGSVHWKNEFPRACTWVRFVDKQTGRGLFVYNMQLDHASVASREYSARLLVRQIARRQPTEPVIVMGDFNDSPSSRTLRILRGQEITAGAEDVQLVDTWLPPGLHADREGTYHEFAGRSEGAKIDTILTVPESDILWAEIDRRIFYGQYPSDHFPVGALIRLPGR